MRGAFRFPQLTLWATIFRPSGACRPQGASGSHGLRRGLLSIPLRGLTQPSAGRRGCGLKCSSYRASRLRTRQMRMATKLGSSAAADRYRVHHQDWRPGETRRSWKATRFCSSDLQVGILVVLTTCRPEGRRYKFKEPGVA